MHPLALSLVLFCRVGASDALTHPTRHAIVERLRREPGATPADLALRFGIDPKTVVHHVRVLRRLGWVRIVPDGRRRRCFLAGWQGPAPVPPRSVQALRAVAAGADGPAALAFALDIPRGTAGSLLDALARRGLLERDGARWRLAPTARTALGLGDGRAAT